MTDRETIAREQVEIMNEAKMLLGILLPEAILQSRTPSAVDGANDFRRAMRATDVTERAYWTDGVWPLYVDSCMRPSEPTGLLTIAAQSHKLGGWGATS